MDLAHIPLNPKDPKLAEIGKIFSTFDMKYGNSDSNLDKKNIEERFKMLEALKKCIEGLKHPNPKLKIRIQEMYVDHLKKYKNPKWRCV
ncbi:hypothetical protein HCUR_00160 [Holospora curviuscula]|uniref:Uncharacterized protein n=1 Tax=Holospora curviuscula TaxID=1082868 RepID=A0A2S5R962_9PROT|nr:hypothetical protein HCUR_00624 [Holospora curviuscula]PPE05703.1 hypothetical protein HCUR_00160 [Holospora curviuscula]